VAIQLYCAVTPVERTRLVVSNVDTDAACALVDEPAGQQAEELGRDTSSSVRSHDINPLKLAVTPESLGEVTGSVPDGLASRFGHPQHAR
jgi:hypothetical protein